MQELQFRVSFEQAPTGVCLSLLIPGGGGRLIRVNPALCSMLGHPDSSALFGRSYLEFIHPLDRHLSLTFREALQRGQQSVEFEQRLLHRSGHTIWASVRGRW